MTNIKGFKQKCIVILYQNFKESINIRHTTIRGKGLEQKEEKKRAKKRELFYHLKNRERQIGKKNIARSVPELVARKTRFDSKK